MEIRDYVRRARREPSREHIVEMWRAILTLKAWYFLPARAEEGPNRPMILEVDGAPWMPAFTDVRRYRSFAHEAGRVDDDGEIHSLVLDPGASLRRIRSVDSAIEGVVFNPDSDFAVRTPVEALLAYARKFDVPSFGD